LGPQTVHAEAGGAGVETLGEFGEIEVGGTISLLAERAEVATADSVLAIIAWHN